MPIPVLSGPVLFFLPPLFQENLKVLAFQAIKVPTNAVNISGSHQPLYIFIMCHKPIEASLYDASNLGNAKKRQHNMIRSKYSTRIEQMQR